MSIDRYTLSLTVMAIPFAGIAVGFPFQRVRQPSKWRTGFAGATAAATILASVLFAGRATDRSDDYKWWGFHNESFAVGYLLIQELHEPQMLPSLGEGADIILWMPGEIPVSIVWHIALMTGEVDRYRLVQSPEIPANLLNNDNLVIVQAGNLEKEPEEDFRLVTRIGNFRLFESGGTDAKE